VPRPKRLREPVRLCITLTRAHYEALNRMVEEGVCDSISSAIRRLIDAFLRTTSKATPEEGAGPLGGPLGGEGSAPMSAPVGGAEGGREGGEESGGRGGAA